MKASSLKGLAVVSVHDAEKLGSIADVFFDLATGQVVAFHVSSGMIGGTKTLLAPNIHNIGPDALTIKDRAALQSHAGPDYQSAIGFNQLHKMKVVSTQGTLLGELGDVEFDPGTLRIEHYEMTGTLWEQMRGKERTFDQVPGLRFGKDLLIVPDTVAAALGTATGKPAADPPPAAPES
ncbi:MAG TPA: PRC-barrel domain-containing protein [Chloroflexia bacterium]|nr:PRC-barrel domain-containing protein [Chloroflexia bacterium]